MATSKESINLTFTQKGKKIGVIAALIVMFSGLGSAVKGMYDGIKLEPSNLARNNEKKILKLDAKTQENEKNIGNVYEELRTLNATQKQIIFLLKR